MGNNSGKIEGNPQKDGSDQPPASPSTSRQQGYDAAQQRPTGIGGHYGEGNPDSLPKSMQIAIQISKRVLGRAAKSLEQSDPPQQTHYLRDNQIAKTDQQPESRPSSPDITSIAELAKIDMLDDGYLKAWESFVLSKKKPSDHTATMQHQESGESSRQQERVEEKVNRIKEVGEYIQNGRSSMILIDVSYKGHSDIFYKKGGFAYALFDSTKDILLQLSDNLQKFDMISGEDAQTTRKAIEKFKTNIDKLRVLAGCLDLDRPSVPAGNQERDRRDTQPSSRSSSSDRSPTPSGRSLIDKYFSQVLKEVKNRYDTLQDKAEKMGNINSFLSSEFKNYPSRFMQLSWQIEEQRGKVQTKPDSENITALMETFSEAEGLQREFLLEAVREINDRYDALQHKFAKTQKTSNILSRDTSTSNSFRTRSQGISDEFEVLSRQIEEQRGKVRTKPDSENVLAFVKILSEAERLEQELQYKTDQEIHQLSNVWQNKLAKMKKISNVISWNISASDEFKALSRQFSEDLEEFSQRIKKQTKKVYADPNIMGTFSEAEELQRKFQQEARQKIDRRFTVSREGVHIEKKPSSLNDLKTLTDLLQFVPIKYQDTVKKRDQRAKEAFVKAASKVIKPPKELVDFVKEHYDVDPPSGGKYLTFTSKKYQSNDMVMEIDIEKGILVGTRGYRENKEEKVYLSDIQRYTCINREYEEIPINEYHSQAVSNDETVEIANALYYASIQLNLDKIAGDDTLHFNLDKIGDDTLHFTKGSAAFQVFLGGEANLSRIYFARDMGLSIEEVTIQNTAKGIINSQWKFTPSREGSSAMESILGKGTR